MEKVLIIAYYYPPCNLTAARRVESFAKYLHKHNYKPIVVTRKWETEVKTPADILTQTTSGINIVREENSEIHYLPYKPCLRDRLFQKSKNPFYKILSKVLTITQILGYYFSVKSVPFNNIYFHSKKLIKEYNISKVIISANPFEIFLFGYLLKRKLNINWIADYRDDWNTSELPEYTERPRFIKKIESFYEKKWLSTSSISTTISPYYAEKIGNFINRPSDTILNGFDFNFDLLLKPKYNPDFTIVYTGTLYESQNIEIFLEGFKQTVEELKFQGLKIIFPGLAFNQKQALRVSDMLKGFEKHYTITDRIPFEQVIEIQRKAHLMLMVPHNNIKGIPSSKLYEYIGLGKRVLLCPTDNDIIEETITDCKLGEVFTNKEEVKEFLVNSVLKQKEWEDKSLSDFQIEKISSYSRVNQLIKLALLLNKL